MANSMKKSGKRTSRKHYVDPDYEQTVVKPAGRLIAAIGKKVSAAKLAAR